MFAVVFLLIPKKQVIVPVRWIMTYDQLLEQEKLWNTGKNSNQNRRIFWSDTAVMRDDSPDPDYMPKFYLNLVEEFPPPNGANEACYIGRVKRYCSKYLNVTFLIFL